MQEVVQFDPIAYLRAVHAARFTNPKLEHLALKMLATANDAGICNRSVLELCNAIGVGERQLANLRRELAAEGFIALEERGLGRGHMSKWRLVPQSLNTAISSPLNAARESDGLQTVCGAQSVGGGNEAVAGDLRPVDTEAEDTLDVAASYPAAVQKSGAEAKAFVYDPLALLTATLSPEQGLEL